MKYDDFKIFKFSTISKSISRIRDNFLRNYKSIKRTLSHTVNILVSIIKYISSGIYKSVKFIVHDFSKIYKDINYKIYNVFKIYRYSNFRKYKSFEIYRYLDYRKYNFSKIYKYLYIKQYKYAPAYFISAIVLAAIIYLSIPMFFSYDKSKVENIVCKEISAKCSIQGKIKYGFFPYPSIKFGDFIIKDFTDKSKTLVKAEKVEIKISFYNLYDKEKLNYTKIKLKNVEINFDLGKLKEYGIFSSKKFSSIPIRLTKGKIKFFEDKKDIAIIKNVNFKFNSDENIDEATLKGDFLGDKIYISLENKKKKSDDNLSKTFILKLLDSKLFAKINIFDSNLDKNTVSGNILLKRKKNKLSAVFDHNNGRIIIKNANLKNFFTNGQFNGEIKILPYFNFDLNLDLERINFNRLSSFLVELDKESKKNLFKIGNKINGQLTLSGDKIYSKYNLINSLESRLRFVNGNILFDQLLLNLGKLGAADVTGIIRNEKEFTNFIFEGNVFLDDLKRFYNKFGIYNKQNNPFNLFISGNLDLVNLTMRLKEISDDQKMKDEDVAYIEKEFNNLVLEEGYTSLFNFLKLKQFIRLVTTEMN